MRNTIVAGNWKMNNDLEEGKKLTSEIIHMLNAESNANIQVILIPSFVHLTSIRNLIGSSKNIFLGAQNCNENEPSARTGEVSAMMLRSAGASHVIIGHSERREHFGETDNLLALKVKKTLDSGLIPIFCCGEKLESREHQRQEKVVKSQIETALFDLDEQEIQKVVIAYEPVWAIGTGKTASAMQAQEMHAFVRGMIVDNYSQKIANSISILYGGSVKPENASDIFSKPDVDGGLIGGASLKSRDFTDIVIAASRLTTLPSL